jgi:acetyl-CoA/propionyl-CoA carboxylase biotin carboxyl carrier protein
VAAGLAPEEAPRAVLVAAALAEPAGPAGLQPWNDATGWRLGGGVPSRWRALDGRGSDVEVEIRVDGSAISGTSAGHPFAGSHHRRGRRVAIELDGVARDLTVAHVDGVTWVGAGGQAWSFRAAPLRSSSGGGAAAGTTVVSPMPGSVISVPVEVGDAVDAGQALVVVEAMKMEHTLRAAAPGVVTEVAVAVGQQVSLSQLLVVVRPLAGDADHQANDRPRSTGRTMPVT